jgi:hypothetical protein
MYLPRKPVAAKDSDEVDSTGMTESQKTALTVAWSLFTRNSTDHSANIAGRFYEKHFRYLQHWQFMDNGVMHRHSDKVYQMFNEIVKNLRDSSIFDQNLCKIKKAHKKLSKIDIANLNSVIKDYFLEQVERHKTKTLEEAVDILMGKIEAKFDGFDAICGNED